MDKIEKLKKERPEIYRTIELDLSIARKNECIKFEGNSINPLNIEGNLTIRLNNPSNHPIPLNRITHLQLPFHEIYITNPIQPNKKATLILGSSHHQFDFHGIDIVTEKKLNTLIEKFTPVWKSYTGTTPLSVLLDTIDGRPNLQIYLYTDAAATFTMEGSPLPPSKNFWIQFDSLSFTAAGEKFLNYTNTFRFIKVKSNDTNVNTHILIVASR